ncbi:DUF222 domain-containing protein [Angustibacter sp. McL0619]|uniref:HNH endonuclease signature motif containing protein n=1 Tax=Angustibacter sp. McL0619 TaxID=3415676 RepID=UPI003CFB4437
MSTTPASPTSEASAALTQVLSGLARLTAVASWQVSDDDLADSVAVLDQVSRLALAQSSRLLAEAGSRGLPGQGGHGRLEHWLRAKVPTSSPRTAAALARRSERLFTSALAAELQPTREALLSGAVSAEQADVVAGAVEALLPPTVPAGVVPDDAVVQGQTFLLEQAAHFDPVQLRRLATHLQHRLDPEADARLARDEDAQTRARALTLATTGGMVHVDGLLTQQCGAALRTALDALTAPQPATDGTPDPRSAAQRRHDGLQKLAEQAVTSPDLLPTTHGSPYRIVVTVPHETLAATLDGSAVAGLPPAILPDGTPVSSTTLATVGCTADLLPVVLDGAGNPLDVGRTQRSFTAKQRHALAVRDRGCTWPGCGAPPEWTDAHHLVPWSEGGPTDLQNAALLCGRHHRYVHGTSQTGRLVDGEVTWDTGPPDTPPGGPPRPTVTRATRLLDALTRRWRLS